MRFVQPGQNQHGGVVEMDLQPAHQLDCALVHCRGHRLARALREEYPERGRRLTARIDFTGKAKELRGAVPYPDAGLHDPTVRLGTRRPCSLAVGTLEQLQKIRHPLGEPPGPRKPFDPGLPLQPLQHAGEIFRPPASGSVG